MERKKIEPEWDFIPNKHLDMMIKGKVSFTATKVYIALVVTQWRELEVGERLERISEATRISIPNINKALRELQKKKMVIDMTIPGLSYC